MAYGYYIDGSGNYYEGDKLDAGDTEVTRRPADYYDWNGSSWDYNLTRTKEYAKAVFNAAMNADVDAVFVSAGLGTADIMAYAAATADVNRLADNASAPDAEIPILAGYVDYAGGTNAAASAAITAGVQYVQTIIGHLFAYKLAQIAAIDAAGDGATALAVTYTRPL